MTQQQGGMRRRRPLGVTILAILTILFGIFAVIGGIAIMGISVVGGLFGTTFPAAQAFLYGGLAFALGIVALIGGAGLWGLKRWAWWLVIIIGVIQIIYYGIFGNYITVALWAIIVIYLIAVRKAFMGAPRPMMP